MKIKKEKCILYFMFIFITFSFSLPVLSQEIHSAVQKGDIEKIKTLLEQNPGLINAKDTRQGLTPLHWAAYIGKKDVATLLIEKGADVNVTGQFNDTPLHYSILGSHKSVAEFLISKGAYVNSRFADGKTSLHFAVSMGKTDMVKMLIENGADIDIRDSSGLTPLYGSVTGSNGEIVNLLMEKGLDIDTDSEEGMMMLHEATSHGHKKFVELMIEKGADIRKKNNHGGTLMHSASSGGLTELVISLIKKGAELNNKNIYGLTPLHLAASRGHMQVVKLLVEKGACLKARSNDNSTPLHCAQAENQSAIVNMLISLGAERSPKKFPVLKGEYLGQKKPGMMPEVFAPGIVSRIDCFDMASCFSPDGKEFFFTRRKIGTTDNRMFYMKLQNGRWTEPESAPFAYDCFEFEPFISPDGKKLFYGSRRPIPGKTELNRNNDIWMVEKTGETWGEPEYYGTGMMFVTVTKDGSLYFTGTGSTILKSAFLNGSYSVPVTVGSPESFINPGAHPFIAPDESYLIFDTRGRPDGYGDNDLYISFRSKDGSWSKTKNMGDKINSNFSELAANVSPDGKYLFFMSKKSGVPDIYWVDAKIIEKLKPKELK